MSQPLRSKSDGFPNTKNKSLNQGHSCMCPFFSWPLTYSRSHVNRIGLAILPCFVEHKLIDSKRLDTVFGAAAEHKPRWIKVILSTEERTLAMFRYGMIALLTAAFLGLAGSGCATVPDSEASRDVLQTQVQQTIDIFKAADPDIETLFKNAYGYAVLPKVVKGAFLVGGGHGQGHVFEQGKMIGYCSASQASIGASIGGQTFRELIFFEDADALTRFCNDGFSFSAQVTALAIKSGAALNAKYQGGMIVFVKMDTGLMADASAGGQAFKYVPKSQVD